MKQSESDSRSNMKCHNTPATIERLELSADPKYTGEESHPGVPFHSLPPEMLGPGRRHTGGPPAVVKLGGEEQSQQRCQAKSDTDSPPSDELFVLIHGKSSTRALMRRSLERQRRNITPA